MSKWEKGSILIIALFVAGLLGFVVASYLQMTLWQLKLANRNFYVHSAINLAEAGAETAVLALNRQDWTGWSISGVDALRVLNPIAPHLYHRLTVATRRGTSRERVAGETTYTHQLRAFVHAVRQGVSLPTGARDGVANMRVIDAIYREAGLSLRGA